MWNLSIAFFSIGARRCWHFHTLEWSAGKCWSNIRKSEEYGNLTFWPMQQYWNRVAIRPQINTRDPRPPIPPLAMASSAMAQIGGLRVFADHRRENKCKTNAPTIFASPAAFYAYLSSCSDRSRRIWHTHLTNYGYFDYGKTQRPPIWAPCRNKDAQALGSLLYICVMCIRLIAVLFELDVFIIWFHQNKSMNAFWLEVIILLSLVYLWQLSSCS